MTMSHCWFQRSHQIDHTWHPPFLPVAPGLEGTALSATESHVASNTSLHLIQSNPMPRSNFWLMMFSMHYDGLIRILCCLVLTLKCNYRALPDGRSTHLHGLGLSGLLVTGRLMQSVFTMMVPICRKTSPSDLQP